MRIAIEGCCHGELDNIYATIEEAQALAPEGSPKVDLLLICGDFQAIRNPSDLLALAVPEKYRQLGGFHRYYSGDKVAPILTLVIGGNHEASNYMWELFHGGWLAPNIYYLGAAGSVLVNGVRISGASGIYKSHDYRKGRHEGLPYDRSTIRSTYHTRQYDIERLRALPLVGARPTIVLSHDWPLEIERYGDTGALVRKKPFFKDEIDSNTLGSPPLRDLLETLRPQYWFAAHLHVKFAALFKHNREATTVRYPPRQPHAPPRNGQQAEAKTNPDELLIADDEEDDAADNGQGDAQQDDGMDALMAELERKEAELSRQAGAAAASALAKAANPTELDIPDDDDAIVDEDPACTASSAGTGTATPLQEGLTDVIPANGIDESVAVLEKAADNPDQIMMDEDDEEFEQAAIVSAPLAAEAPVTGTGTGSGEGSLNSEAAATRFLALSKCLPGQDFLQFLDIPTPSDASASPPLLAFDPHWLAITRAFQPLLSLSAHQPPLPTDLTVRKGTIEAHLAWVRETLPGGGEGIEIASVQQFQMTAPAPGTPGGDVRGPGPWYTNPQTEALCEMLGLSNKVNPVPEEVRLARQQEQMAQTEPQQKQGAPAAVAEESTADAALHEAEPATV